MSYITTYTGKHFDPIQPEPGLFDLTDISHALSLLCRGNGHMKHFYSVAQHSIACAEEAKARGQIFEIDDAMLSWEFRELMAEELGDGWKQLKTAPDCSFAGMEDVEKRFSVWYRDTNGQVERK